MRCPLTKREAVRAVRPDLTIRATKCDRVEMVLRSNAGWSGRRSQTLGLPPNDRAGRAETPRPDGLVSRAALRPTPLTVAHRERVEAVPRALRDEDRTAGRQRNWLRRWRGGTVSPSAPVRRAWTWGYIAAWRRTGRSLRHTQDPAKDERAVPASGRREAKPRSAGFDSPPWTSAASSGHLHPTRSWPRTWCRSCTACRRRRSRPWRSWTTSVSTAARSFTPSSELWPAGVPVPNPTLPSQVLAHQAR
jgi:hypothetical protein